MFLRLIFSILVILLAGQLTAAEKTDTKLPPPLNVSEINWLFGFIPKDTWVAHHYILSNPHKDTITITKIDPGCDCTHPPEPPIKIPPGESQLFRILFDTRTYFGDTDRDIRLETDFKPNPEMFLYFMSVAARDPRTIRITPQSTAFIVGKESQEFIIKNLKGENADFKIFLDHDSSLTVSETQFTLDKDEERKIEVKPLWDRLPAGPNYRCLVLEVIREKEFFRVSIPIKINKF